MDETPFSSLPFSDLLFGLEPIRAVQEFFGLGHPLPFELFSLLGDTWGLMLVIGIALWVWGRRVAYPVAGIVMLGALTKELMNVIFPDYPRPRGPGVVVYEHLPTSSFPSGHVYEAIAPWGLLWRYDRLPIGPTLLVAALVSLGRLYLASHFLGDVVAGIVLAVLLVWVFPPLWRRVDGWLQTRSFRFYALGTAAAIAGMAVNLYLNRDNLHRWEVVGFGAGLITGLLLEYRYVRFTPRRVGGAEQALKVAVGVAGVVLLMVLHRQAGDDARLLLSLTAALGGLWTVAGAPALFRWMGLSEPAPA